MSENTAPKRLSKVAVELNVGRSTIVDYLHSKGVSIDDNPNTKIDPDTYNLLLKEFLAEKTDKEKAKNVSIAKEKRVSISIEDEPKKTSDEDEEIPDQEEILIKNLAVSKEKEDVVSSKPFVEQINQPKVLGKIDLDSFNKKKKVEEVKPPVEVVANSPIEEIKPKEEIVEKQVDVPEPVKIEVKATEPVVIIEQEKLQEKVEIKQEPKAQVDKNKPVEEKPEPEAKIELIEAKPIEVSVAEVITNDAEEPVLPTEAINPPSTPVDDGFIKTKYTKLEGPTILGKIVLPSAAPKKEEKPKPVASSSNYDQEKNKKKRKRIRTDKVNPTEFNKANSPNTPGQQGTSTPNQGQNNNRPGQAGQQGQGNRGPNQGNNRPNQGGSNQNRGNNNNNRGPSREIKAPLTDEQIQSQIKETLARLSNTGKSKTAKYRRQKRDENTRLRESEEERSEAEKSILRVTEFVTANQLATMMEVGVTKIISACMSLGLFVSINQRLDAETISIVAEEFGFKVEFVTVEAQEAIEEDDDNPDDLKERAPIVTVMGHVDHGKTSLLDYIRKANVIAGEAGGITQHIGAYSVKVQNGKYITFLDTPGHEAFTAMRARGAKVTDVAIIVIAADDSVMPQTIEAINHAQAAGVPIVFAFNKIDKPNANPNKIKEDLAKLNILVEEWGGKYQVSEVSAKSGLNVNELLDKVLLESEILELKANANRKASGTIIESSLDKGRGYMCTLLVQNGTLRVGDLVLAGPYCGRVKALFNERNMPIKEAGPSAPALMLGLDGAPQAGDRFNVMTDEREAREIASKRMQILREQGMRSQKHITLDEIGRRLAIGDFKELNIIIKGDVDGSIEALADSLLKLSTEKIQINIIHKSVGQISESDVLLASASNAIIVGFQVRPSTNARKLAENEQIDIRLYSIIYDAINEVKAAMEGMLAPEFEEKITGNVEIRETFKISKVGTIAGCMVTDGKVYRNSKIRIIRDGIVVFTGGLASLKRFKDDVKEVSAGYECGLNIDGYNDIKNGDIIEAYEMVQIKAKL